MRCAVLALSVAAAAVACHKNDHGGIAPTALGPLETNAVDDQDPKARELAALPVGIRVSHSPNPVKAQAGGRSGRRYTWLYETRVAPTSEDVSIVEFGALVRSRPRGDSWKLQTIYDRPFTAAEFAEWYSCPGGLLREGTACVDQANYTGGDQLHGFETRWYFIGRTRAGRLVKGEEIVRGSPEVPATPRQE